MADSRGLRLVTLQKRKKGIKFENVCPRNEGKRKSAITYGRKVPKVPAAMVCQATLVNRHRYMYTLKPVAQKEV